MHRARNIKISVTRARAHYFYYSLLFWFTLTGLLQASGSLQETKKKTFQALPTQEQTDMISGRKRENGSLAFTFIEKILLILTLTRRNERLDITLKTQLNPFQAEGFKCLMQAFQTFSLFVCFSLILELEIFKNI